MQKKTTSAASCAAAEMACAGTNRRPWNSMEEFQ